MTWKKLGSATVLRFERGERIVAALTAFCREAGLGAAQLDGLGTCRNAELGFYSIETGAYAYRTIAEDCEIASLVGNVSRLDGAPRVHIHIVLADSGFRAWGGHLKEAEVLAACEIVLRPLEGGA
jgi:uncharacterized protein